MSSIDAIAADIYESLGEHERAAMIRANLDPHEDCTSEYDRVLESILHAVPDAPRSAKHSATCWQRHAACLRNKIYEGLEWK